jgi:hypothetical protein
MTEGTHETEGQGNFSVALMLAAAAIVAAALGGRAALLSSQSSDAWQSAVRQEVKRAAAVVEDIRFVYVDEAPLAYEAAKAKIRAAELRGQAPAGGGATRDFVLTEARVQDTLVETADGASEVVGDPAYALDGGGFDLTLRLADQRNRFPDLVAIDPDEPQEQGDELGRHTYLAVAATIPASVAFLLGAAAQAFARRRRVLLLAGWPLVIASLVLGIVLEIAL